MEPSSETNQPIESQSDAKGLHAYSVPVRMGMLGAAILIGIAFAVVLSSALQQTAVTPHTAPEEETEQPVTAEQTYEERIAEIDAALSQPAITDGDTPATETVDELTTEERIAEIDTALSQPAITDGDTPATETVDELTTEERIAEIEASLNTDPVLAE